MRITPLRTTTAVLLLICGITSPAFSQTARSDTPVFTTVFPPEEFAARRARVLSAIGDGVAVLQGAAERDGEQPFRQNNAFFYLTGVEVPRAIAVLDGRTKRTTLYLQDVSRSRRMYGPLLGPTPDAAKLAGVDAVLPRDSFATAVAAFERDARTIFTPHRPEVFSTGTAEASTHARLTKADPWDGRVSREEAFIAKLRAVAPRVQIVDLDSIVTRIRAIKSPREIEVLREATRITGLGIMEAMRDAKPGMREYELQASAEYVFKRAGSYGGAYFPLIATGTNTLYSHYYKNAAVLQDGDLVQFDYAPDYKYYVSDVTRVFPANGKFTPRQREFYSIYLDLYQALIGSIKPYTPPRDIIKAAVVRMDSIMAARKFTDPKIEAAARMFVERYRNSRSNSLGHTIGIEVHDVRLGSDSLLPGHIFTVEPAMIIEDEHLGIRLEDVILITEKGYENLSGFVPVRIEDIERLMGERGLGEYVVVPSKR